MQVIKANDYKQMSAKAALFIAGQIMAKRNSVLGFATGSTPIGTYEELVRLHKEAGLDFSAITTFNLDEYYNCPITDKNSYHYFMHERLFDHVNLRRDAIHLPNGMAPDADKECIAYEQAIVAKGGVDLQLLGIGHNGHIGFNEPAGHFAQITSLVELTASTIDANARFYSSRDEVPKSALSMGIGTIMQAKKILLLVSGAEKRAILDKALYGPVTPEVPASILQFHRNVTVITAVE